MGPGGVSKLLNHYAFLDRMNKMGSNCREKKKYPNKKPSKNRGRSTETPTNNSFWSSATICTPEWCSTHCRYKLLGGSSHTGGRLDLPLAEFREVPDLRRAKAEDGRAHVLGINPIGQGVCLARLPVDGPAEHRQRRKGNLPTQRLTPAPIWSLATIRMSRKRPKSTKAGSLPTVLAISFLTSSGATRQCGGRRSKQSSPRRTSRRIRCAIFKSIDKPNRLCASQALGRDASESLGPTVGGAGRGMRTCGKL